MCHSDAEANIHSRKAEFKKALSKYEKKKKEFAATRSKRQKKTN